jgi:hypothetical protein
MVFGPLRKPGIQEGMVWPLGDNDAFDLSVGLAKLKSARARESRPKCLVDLERSAVGTAAWLFMLESHLLVLLVVLLPAFLASLETIRPGEIRRAQRYLVFAGLDGQTEGWPSMVAEPR